jgi:hypothetical protein
VRSMRGADNLMSRLSRQCGILNISQPYRLPRPVTGIALLHSTGFTEPLTETSTGNIKKKSFWDVKCGWCVGLTILPPSMSRLSRQRGILNISEPFRPPRPVTAIAFTSLLTNTGMSAFCALPSLQLGAKINTSVSCAVIHGLIGPGRQL